MKIGDRYYLPTEPFIDQLADAMTVPILTGGAAARVPALLDTSCICYCWELLADCFDGDRTIPVRRHYRDGGFDYDVVSEADLATKLLIPPLPMVMVAIRPEVTNQAVGAPGQVIWHIEDGRDWPLGAVVAAASPVAESKVYDFDVYHDRLRGPL